MSNTDLLNGDVETQAESSGSGEQASQSNGSATTPKRRPGGLSGMVIAELRALATELGIGDTTGMRKGDLIAAIRERQGKNKRGKSTGEAPSAADEASGAATLPLDGVSEAKGKAEQPADDKPAKAGGRSGTSKGAADEEKSSGEGKSPGEGKPSGENRPSGDGRSAGDGQQDDGGGGRSGRRRRGS
ncbi:Rho termination factor N-terminal domain-containing protein, partial [Saccharomonospora saliphila]|uniref:Rho termination factor N-terminal domain-containing protein n=1 Tax=Saccharomonospora saliphila TaxID=369829 RepID=UPI00066281EA